MRSRRGLSGRRVPIAAGVLAAVAGAAAFAGHATGDASGGFTLRSRVFEDGRPIPARFAADGPNLSPPLCWTGVPAGTRQLALIVEDLDRKGPSGGPWAHWVLYNLSLRSSELPPGFPQELEVSRSVSGAQGVNSGASENIGYRGPDPAAADPPHRYRFRLYALSARLDLPPGLGADQLRRRMEGHVIATADLTGTYDN